MLSIHAWYQGRLSLLMEEINKEIEKTARRVRKDVTELVDNRKVEMLFEFGS